MAGRSQRQMKQTHRLFAVAGGEAAAGGTVSGDGTEDFDELEEFEVWGSPVRDEAMEPVPAGPRKKLPWSGSDYRRRETVPASLPVNIPDWSKTLREEAAARRGDGVESWEGEEIVPSHEYLWNKRGGTVSFSVHEGAGRTLKGRDLSRVRNAVWRQIGLLE